MNLPDEDLLEINLDRLEDDSRGHPRLTYKYGKALAEARKAVKEAKNSMKLWAAIKKREIRADPSNYGVEKVTVDAVKTVVEEMPDYQRMELEIIDLEFDEDQLDAFMKGAASRDRQIEVLAKLHGQTYWSKPDTSGKEKEGQEIIQRRVNESVGKKKKPKS